MAERVNFQASGLWRDAIHTTVPGLDICELLPRHAALADKFSLIRSVSHEFSAHAGGIQQVLTGRAPKEREKDEPDFPDLGAIFKKVRGAAYQAVLDMAGKSLKG